LEERLVYGGYPQLRHLKSLDEKKAYLNNMLNSYLLKDILVYENVKNASKIYNLLKLIAFQIGGEVSLQELGNKLSICKNTVDKYLDLLCKMFILHRVDGFSRNLQKEITKSSKWYFVDNGIRNVVISNFNPIVMRNDKGQLWENYAIAERLKHKEYHQIFWANYFWRTYDQQETYLATSLNTKSKKLKLHHSGRKPTQKQSLKLFQRRITGNG
jgi:predicted AAA+ superfamily ATPase